jgi:hypothetical protein
MENKYELPAFMITKRALTRSKASWILEGWTGLGERFFGLRPTHFGYWLPALVDLRFHLHLDCCIFGISVLGSVDQIVN